MSFRVSWRSGAFGVFVATYWGPIGRRGFGGFLLGSYIVDLSGPGIPGLARSVVEYVRSTQWGRPKKAAKA